MRMGGEGGGTRVARVKRFTNYRQSPLSIALRASLKACAQCRSASVKSNCISEQYWRHASSSAIYEECSETKMRLHMSRSSSMSNAARRCGGVEQQCNHSMIRVRKLEGAAVFMLFFIFLQDFKIYLQVHAGNQTASAAASGNGPEDVIELGIQVHRRLRVEHLGDPFGVPRR